jgi:predicted DNA-binding transcriptional regulator YafY
LEHERKQMKLARLLGITLILLNKPGITARELAERFEVSSRTIYRDIDELSAAGVPVTTNQGNNGGIALLDSFVLNRSVLTESERDSLILALKTLRATRYPEIDSTLDKIGALFRKAEAADWVHIEFSPWGSGPNEENKFIDIKRAILDSRVIAFDYHNSTGTSSRRKAEPRQLIFKSQAWYIWAYCLMRAEFRLFRVSRMRNVKITNEIFERKQGENIAEKPQSKEKIPPEIVTLKLRFQPQAMFRVYDDYDETKIKHNPDGSAEVILSVPADEWVYGYVMSFENNVEVIEPAEIRDEIKKRLLETLKLYR